MTNKYITALDAAAQIQMSPARFANLLRENRDALPIQIDHGAIHARGGFFLGGDAHALNRFYTGIGNDFLHSLKIHRLDWDAYVASATPPQPPARLLDGLGTRRDMPRA